MVKKYSNHLNIMWSLLRKSMAEPSVVTLRKNLDQLAAMSVPKECRRQKIPKPDMTQEDENYWKNYMEDNFNLTEKYSLKDMKWKEIYKNLELSPDSSLIRQGAELGKIKLIEYGLDKNYQDWLNGKSSLYNQEFYLWNAIEIAAERGHYDIVKNLIRREIHFEIKPWEFNKKLDPVLDKAAAGGHKDIILFLIEVMEKNNVKPNYKSAINEADWAKQFEIRKFLKELDLKQRVKDLLEDFPEDKIIEEFHKNKRVES